MTKQDIMSNLAAFVNKRPNLEFANYGDLGLYRRDYREHCQKPKQDFNKLVDAVLWRENIDSDAIRQGFREAFGGRLDLHNDGTIEYTPGQYGATEYRHAACSVLSRVLWSYWASDAPEGVTPREHVTRNARREFGRGITARYFD